MALRYQVCAHCWRTADGRRRRGTPLPHPSSSRSGCGRSVFFARIAHRCGGEAIAREEAREAQKHLRVRPNMQCIVGGGCLVIAVVLLSLPLCNSQMTSRSMTMPCHPSSCTGHRSPSRSTSARIPSVFHQIRQFRLPVFDQAEPQGSLMGNCAGRWGRREFPQIRLPLRSKGFRRGLLSGSKFMNG